MALAVLAACGGEERPGGGGGRQELVVGAGADASPSGAFQARLGVYPLNVNVAETLVRLAPDFEVEPSLATSWEQVGENTWRFHLRRGVRFHDGQPLDARAVRESILQVATRGLGYSFLGEESVRVVDDYTVDVAPTEPNLQLPLQLVHPNYGIFAPGTDPAVRPVGTGPFRFVEYRPHERIVVERNDSYWGERARLERITFRFFPDHTTRVLALSAGEVDLVMDLPREQVATVERRPDLRVARAPVGAILALQINSHGQRPYDLLRDRRLRRALGYAIDRAQLVRNVWAGEGDTVQNMTVPAVLGSHAGLVRGYPHAPERAAALLTEAGWQLGLDGVRRRDGRPLRLVLLANPESDPGTAEFVQAALRRLGVDVEWARLPDIGSYAARLNRGEFDLNLAVSNQNDANPLFLPALIHYSRSTRPFARWYAAGDRFDRLVEEGMRTAELDRVRRIAAEAIRVAVDEEAVLLPVAGLFRLYALRRGVHGFEPHPSQTNISWTRVRVR